MTENVIHDRPVSPRPNEDGQWAFGTGFEDCQEETTAPVPTGSTPPTSRSTASCSATTR